MEDYSYLSPVPELDDLNGDGIIDADELLLMYFRDSYLQEEFYGENEPASCKALTILGAIILLFDLFFDALLGGRSRVGKRMKSGGYRSRSGSSGGGADFCATMIVCGLCYLVSHPQVGNGSRRAMFRRQSVPPCYEETRRAVKNARRSGSPAARSTSPRVAGTPRTTQNAPKETTRTAPKPTQSKKEEAPRPVQNKAKADSAAASEAAQPAESKKAASVRRKPSVPYSGPAAWRSNCEDGSKYGLDPKNYATEEQYMDALATAKFAEKFHKK